MTSTYVPPHKREGGPKVGTKMSADATVFDGGDTLLLQTNKFEPQDKNGDCADWWYPQAGTYPHLHFRRARNAEGSSLKFLVISYGKQETMRSNDLVANGRLASTYQSAIAEVEKTWGKNAKNMVNEMLMRFGFQVVGPE